MDFSLQPRRRLPPWFAWLIGLRHVDVWIGWRVWGGQAGPTPEATTNDVVRYYRAGYRAQLSAAAVCLALAGVTVAVTASPYLPSALTLWGAGFALSAWRNSRVLVEPGDSVTGHGSDAYHLALLRAGTWTPSLLEPTAADMRRGRKR